MQKARHEPDSHSMAALAIVVGVNISFLSTLGTTFWNSGSTKHREDFTIKVIKLQTLQYEAGAFFDNAWRMTERWEKIVGVWVE